MARCTYILPLWKAAVVQQNLNPTPALIAASNSQFNL